MVIAPAGLGGVIRARAPTISWRLCLHARLAGSGGVLSSKCRINIMSRMHPEAQDQAMKRKPYIGLLMSTGVSFVLMYAIMYSMADRWGNVYLNLSNVYMTGLMAGSMMPVMLLTMPGMFQDKTLNKAAWVVAAAILALCWFLLRAEAGVGDRQFLRAMAPHHSAAIQMVNESTLTDPRVKKLGDEIVSSQEREIAEMKALLAE